MATTTAAISNSDGLHAGYEPFYVLKITGLPYIITGTINPFSSAYTSPWATPSGMTVKQGLQVPEDSLTQRLPDLVGGVAEPERVRLELLDFQAFDSNTAGAYNFFGRLFAPGRAMTDASLTVGYLNADVTTGATTITARGTSTYATTSTAYIGGETFSYTGTSVASGVTTFNTVVRNKFPCVSTNAWPYSFPPVPYYRIPKDSGGGVLPSGNIPVTSEPLIIVGRTAALYVGHLDNGQPVAEASALIRMVGRISSLTYDRGRFVMELESILADVERASVARGLASAEIRDQIVVATGWDTFTVISKMYNAASDAVSEVRANVTIATGTYTALSLTAAVNAAISALSTSPKIALVKDVLNDGKPFFAFVGQLQAGGGGNIVSFVVRGGKVSGAGLSAVTLNPSLLRVLGFTDKNEYASRHGVGAVGDKIAVVADEPIPSVFIPTNNTAGCTLTLSGNGDLGSRFFTDQGDGSSKAYVRFDDGRIVRISAATATTITITNELPGIKRNFLERVMFEGSAYIKEQGEVGKVEQVIVAPEPGLAPAPSLRIPAAFMASDSGASATSALNFYPEGVGLGLGALMNSTDFLGFEVDGAKRRIIVDKSTTLGDMLTPILKETGSFVVWDVATGQIRLRKMSVPTAAVAETLTFSESNRPDPNETTSATWDLTHCRTGWRLKYGWVKDEFSSDVSFVDYWAADAYGVSNKMEEIKDKTLLTGTGEAASLLLQALASRSIYYRYPWVRCARRISKVAGALSPGTIHQVIDATIHNPSTGALGITSTDAIYGLLTRVSHKYDTGEHEIEFLIQSTDRTSLYRPWSPCGLVDFTANTGGYTNGWDGINKRLKMASRYSSTAGYDGIDFVAGDVVTLITYDNDGAPTTNNDTVASVAADGSTVTLTTGGFTPSATVESVLVLRAYASATAARQGNVAWQGDATDGLIVATATNCKWA